MTDSMETGGCRPDGDHPHSSRAVRTSGHVPLPQHGKLVCGELAIVLLQLAESVSPRPLYSFRPTCDVCSFVGVGGEPSASQNASTFMTCMYRNALAVVVARVCVLCREIDGTALNVKPNNRTMHRPDRSLNANPRNEEDSRADVADHRLTMRRWAFAQRKAWADYWNHG